jgi:hypothetical protein
MATTNSLPLLATPVGQKRLPKPTVSLTEDPIAWEQYHAQIKDWKKAGRFAGKEISIQREKDKLEAHKAAKAKDKKDKLAADIKAMVAMADSIAGKKGKFGNLSPYSDLDAKLAKEYVIEMGKNPSTQMFDPEGKNGRLVYHMIAEYHGHQVKNLMEEVKKLKMKMECMRLISNQRDEIILLKRKLGQSGQHKDEFVEMDYQRRIKED